MTDDKIITIETTLAYHERQIQDLSAIINAQWNEIESLKRRLEEAIFRSEDSKSGPAENAKPPHY